MVPVINVKDNLCLKSINAKLNFYLMILFLALKIVYKLDFIVRVHFVKNWIKKIGSIAVSKTAAIL